MGSSSIVFYCDHLPFLSSSIEVVFMKVVFHGCCLTLFFFLKLGCLPFKAILHFSTVLDGWVGGRPGRLVGGGLVGRLDKLFKKAKLILTQLQSQSDFEITH